MALAAVGVALALLYAAWVAWVPLLPSNIFVPLLDLGKMTGYTWPSALLYLGLVVGLYALYAAGYRLVGRGIGSLALVLAFAGFFSLELALAYPATAVDVFGYIAHGRLLAIHHVNPLIVAPAQFGTDPIVSFLAYPDEPSQYGPLWVLLGGGLAALGQANVAVEVLLYKAVGALAILGGAVVAFQIARGLGKTESTARQAAYLYAWNPMLLWEVVGNAHNDALMMLFGLVAVWLATAHRPLLVLPALAVGALIKIPVVVIAPILLLATWRMHRARAIEGVLLAAALAAVVYRPFWEGPDTLTALRRTDLFTASLGSVLRLWLAAPLGLADATTVARAISLGAFVGVALTTTVLAVRARSGEALVRLIYFTLLAALLLATTWFQAWYVVWPLAVGAALADSRRHAEVALLSLGGLLQYFVFIYLWVIGVFPRGENVGVQSAAYLAVIGPLLIAIVLRALNRDGLGWTALAWRRSLRPRGGEAARGL